MPKIGKTEWNPKLVGKLARMHCTLSEISAITGIHRDNLSGNKAFMQVYRKNIALGKKSLRRKQWEKADEGNPTMLIWLGKQYLGQSDQVEQQVTHSIAPEKMRESILSALESLDAAK